MAVEDAFDQTVPVAADIVRDVTPPNLRNIKDYLVHRNMFLGAGIQTYDWETEGDPPTVLVGVGASPTVFYDYMVRNSASPFMMFSCPAGYEGYYRFSGFTRRYFFNPLGSCGIAMQKTEDGETWVSVGEQFYQPGEDDVTGLPFNFVVALQDAAFQVRLLQVMVLPEGEEDSGSIGSDETSEQLQIEFLRPMDVVDS